MALLKLDELRLRSRMSSRSQPPSLRNSSDEAASPEPISSSPQTPDDSPQSACWGAASPATATRISIAHDKDAQNSDSPLSHQSDSNDEEIIMVSPAQWLGRQNSQSTMNLLQENRTPKKESPKTKHTFITVAPTMRCSRLAADLFELVEHDISWIDRMVEDVSLAHQRRVTVQVSEPDVSKDVARISQKDKYAIRKSEGWKRQRFDPRRTQELCKLAMEEL